MQYTLNGATNTYYFHRNPMGDVVGIYDLNNNLVAKYLYDAWGNFTISGNSAIAKANPIRYRGYYYDEDTGLYYCNARYYSPMWRRFISPDDTSYLDPSSVNGLNQYCYCGNDPVSLSHSFSSNASVAPTPQSLMAQSNALNNSIRKPTKMRIGHSKSNNVLMKHHTTSFVSNALIGGFFGNFSYTVTKQLNEAEGFYYYGNVGNGWASYGVGMNWGDWYGMNVYVSENIGIGTSAQLTPWFTFGAELSLLEGVSLSTGIISGNTTHEISANIGWGTIAGAYAFAKAMAFFPSPGARALAGALACLIFIVDLFD